MVSFHWVRGHQRSNAQDGVRPYQRGEGGSEAVAYKGEFKGSVQTRPSSEKEHGFLAKVKANVEKKLDDAKKEREAEKSIREAIRAEEIAKADEMRRQKRLERITREERERARNGPAWKQALKKELASALAPSKQSRPRRKSTRKEGRPRR